MGKRIKNLKGGAVLGKGSFGCVVDPPKMCSSDMTNFNKVSKLINISKVSKAEYDEIVNEYHIGAALRKHDPDGKYFMPGLEMCEITEQDASESLKKDIKKCGYAKKVGSKTKMLNIVMNRGEDFDKVSTSLCLKNQIKTLGYLIYAAKKSLYSYKVGLMDVKTLNLLYKLDGKYIHPVFIDFSPDFVLNDKDDLIDFALDYGSVQYPPWAFELLALNAYLMTEKNTITRQELLRNPRYHNVISAANSMHNIDIRSDDGFETFKQIYEYMATLMKKSDAFEKIVEKLMVFEIGIALLNLSDNDDRFGDLIFELLTPDPRSRPTFNKILNKLKKKYNLQSITRETFLINLASEKTNPVIKNIVNEYNTRLKNFKKSPKPIPKTNISQIKSLKTKIPLNLNNYALSPSDLMIIKIQYDMYSKYSTPKLRRYLTYPDGVKTRKEMINHLVLRYYQNKKRQSKKKTPKPQVNKKSKMKSKTISKSITKIDGCMKMKVKDIKKSSQYKNIPRGNNKSKLKKADLCKLINKYHN